MSRAASCRLGGLLVGALALGAQAQPGLPADPSCRLAAGQVLFIGGHGASARCEGKGAGEYRGSDAMRVSGRAPEAWVAGPATHGLACLIDFTGSLACEEFVGPTRLMSAQDLAWLKMATPLPPARRECSGPEPEEVQVRSRRASKWCTSVKVGSYESPATLGWADPESSRQSSTIDSPESRRRAGRLTATNDIGRIETGRRVKLRVCPEADFGGRCVTLRPDSRETWSAGPIRSLQVFRHCEGAADEAVVHADEGFWGLCVRLPRGRFDSVASLRLNDKPARSLQIGRSSVATACSEEGLQGECRELAAGTQLERGDFKSLHLRAATGPAAASAADAAASAARP